MPAPVVGPAPRMMARPVNFRKSERGRELISFSLFCFFYCVFLFFSRGERIFRYSDLVAEHVGRVSLIPLGAMMIDVMLGNIFFMLESSCVVEKSSCTYLHTSYFHCAS